MRKLWLLIPLLILSGCAARKPEDRTKALWHMQLGMGHLSKGNTPAALGELLKAQELDPSNPLIVNNLGLAYFSRGRLDLAEKAFRRALQVQSRFTEARNNLGRTLIEIDRLDEAIKELKIASEDILYQEPLKVQTNLGIAYFRKRDFLASQNVLEQVLKVQRDNCTGWSYYGRSLYEMSEFTRSASALDTAIEQCRASSLEEIFYYSGLSYLKLGQKEKAIARLEEGLAKVPNGIYAPKAKSMLEILK